LLSFARSPFIVVAVVFELFYSEDFMPFGVLVVVHHATAVGAQGNGGP
jgi:hypothetical protein